MRFGNIRNPNNHSHQSNRALSVTKQMQSERNGSVHVCYHYGVREWHYATKKQRRMRVRCGHELQVRVDEWNNYV